MARLVLALVAALSVSASAYAETPKISGHLGSSEQQRACRPDILRHCRALLEQSDQEMAGCLRSNARNLTRACREALQSAEH
jgi:hypothetical protein